MIGRGGAENQVKSMLESRFSRAPLIRRRVEDSIVCWVEGPHLLDVRDYHSPQRVPSNKHIVSAWCVSCESLNE